MADLLKIEALRLDLQSFGHKSWSLRWSVDGLAKDGLTMSCDPDGCVALCFRSSREFRGCSGLVRLKGTPARLRFRLRLNRMSATCACRGFVRCLKSSC